jgi:hypothetical protein
MLKKEFKIEEDQERKAQIKQALTRLVSIFFMIEFHAQSFVKCFLLI